VKSRYQKTDPPTDAERDREQQTAHEAMHGKGYWNCTHARLWNDGDCTRCPEFDDCPGIAGNKEAR